MPERREDDVGIVGIEGKIDAAAVLIFIEHLAPALAAIGGAEDAALRVGTERMAQRGHKRDVGIFRIHNDAADGLRVAKPAVRPHLAGVDLLVNAIAAADVAAIAGLACAPLADIMIGRRYGK